MLAAPPSKIKEFLSSEADIGRMEADNAVMGACFCLDFG
jgi:hypothetical protein